MSRHLQFQTSPSYLDYDLAGLPDFYWLPKFPCSEPWARKNKTRGNWGRGLDLLGKVKVKCHVPFFFPRPWVKKREQSETVSLTVPELTRDGMWSALSLCNPSNHIHIISIRDYGNKSIP